MRISTPSRTYLTIRKKIPMHVSNRCMFRYNSSTNMDPIEIAARNAGEFFVVRTSNHRGSTQRRTSMEFLVSWKGYSSCPGKRFAKLKPLLTVALQIH